MNDKPEWWLESEERHYNPTVSNWLNRNKQAAGTVDHQPTASGNQPASTQPTKPHGSFVPLTVDCTEKSDAYAGA